MQRFTDILQNLQFLFLPFELLGAFLLALPLFIWKGLVFLCGKFLLSPWGLLVPATFLVLLFLITQVSKTPFQIAGQYAEALKTCKEEDITVYTRLLVQLDEAGLSGLVGGINSEREAVFNACFEGLRTEIKKHQQYRNPKNPFRWELHLSNALLEHTPQLRSPAQISAAALTRSLIHSLTNGIELSYKREQNSDLEKANRNCIQILDLLETADRQQNKSGQPDETPSTAAVFHPRYAHPVLMATNGKPLFQSAASAENIINDELLADTMSVPNAERLLAYYQSPQFLAEQNQTAGRNQPDILRNNGTLLAQMQPPAPVRTQPLLADISGKTASEYPGTADTDRTDEVDIVSDYIANRKSAPNKLKKQKPLNGSGFITDELREIPPDKIPSLSTVNLMRILHHPNYAAVAEAENTLRVRDGFRSIHLQLAHSLFHPDSSVRKELVKKLPLTAGIPQHIWLLELMNDPDADVRYQAAVYLTASADPALRHILAEKGRQDTDQRIVNLSEKISGSQTESPRK